MADDHPHAELFRRAWDAIRDGDAEVMREILADDVVWHMVGEEEPLVGADVVADTLGADIDGLEMEGGLHDVLANDDHVIGLMDVTLRRPGREASYRAVEIAHVADGKITERWAMVDDFAAMAEFWAD